MTQFTPAEIAAADEAFRIHRDGGCEDDCGFCYDLVLSGLASAVEELKRINRLKLERKAGKKRATVQKSLPLAPQSKRVGAGKGNGLKGRVKR